MRNWNSEISIFSLIIFSRFEPTYEELKLRFYDGTLTSIMSFEPTYEELKRRRIGQWFKDIPKF